VIGIDEVGRGCLAGPLLVVAARKVGELPAGITDSKLLSKIKREALFLDIQISCDIGEGWVTSQEIDKLGLSESMRLGTKRALARLNADNAESIVFDGNINYCEVKYLNALAIINADALHPVVSAASVYAKVLRDNYMTNLPNEYRLYQFSKHVGYGTKLHIEMLKQHGVTNIHRRSFKPISVLL